MSEGLDRAHERIDEEITARNKLEVSVASLAASAQHTAESVKKLADSVDRALHHTPCQTATETKNKIDRHIEEHADGARQTVEITREKKRDWRGLWFVIGGTALGGALAVLILRVLGIHP